MARQKAEASIQRDTEIRKALSEVTQKTRGLYFLAFTAGFTYFYTLITLSNTISSLERELAASQAALRATNGQCDIAEGPNSNEEFEIRTPRGPMISKFFKQLRETYKAAGPNSNEASDSEVTASLADNPRFFRSQFFQESQYQVYFPRLEPELPQEKGYANRMSVPAPDEKLHFSTHTAPFTQPTQDGCWRSSIFAPNKKVDASTQTAEEQNTPSPTRSHAFG